jgi:hypothetical protein
MWYLMNGICEATYKFNYILFADDLKTPTTVNFCSPILSLYSYLSIGNILIISFTRKMRSADFNYN